jgi:predicted RNase H-like nuclease (RuvC/YqgF family)
MRLSMKEVQKQHESTKKLYEQGLTVAPVDVKQVLDLYDTIEALQQENEQLKEQINTAKIGWNTYKTYSEQLEQQITDLIVEVDTIEAMRKHIEALQAENEQLKADCDRMLGEVQELTMEYNHFKERLQISPYGDDKIDELDEALENCKFQYEQLKQENKQLRAQVARYKEILEQASDALKYAEGYTQYSAEARVREAVAAIDKALGGKEDAGKK